MASGLFEHLLLLCLLLVDFTISFHLYQQTGRYGKYYLRFLPELLDLVISIPTTILEETGTGDLLSERHQCFLMTIICDQYE